MMSLAEHLDCSWAVSHYSLFLWAYGYADENGTFRHSLPVYGEHHFLYAALYLVLRLQVSHVLCWFSIDGKNYIPDA